MSTATFSRQVQGHSVYAPALQRSLQRLDALVDWERRSRTRGAQRLMRVDVKPSASLLEAVGSPQTAYRSVHVTGSKGKGSVCALVGAGLSACGARVGVYGSPHVERVNERVRIAGEQIGDDELAVALDEALDARESRGIVDATWFDVISTAGFLALKRAGVDWAVVEVGLGGRLDSTNVLNAPVAVVTNISLEHQDIIGPTLRDIAFEKAGIIHKSCQPIVGMPPDGPLSDIFVREAAKVGACDVEFVTPTPGSSITAHNIALARSALCAARPGVDAKAMLSDLVAQSALAALPGRMELFQVRTDKVLKVADGRSHSPELARTVDVTLDGTHVAESVARLLGELREREPLRPVVLLALGKEKDAAGICAAIREAQPVCTVVTAVSRDDPYMPVAELLTHATEAGNEPLLSAADPAEALETAVREAACRATHLVVIGSLHLAGKVRPLLIEASSSRTP